MWKKNDLTELLGVRYPIIQAPMALVTTPALAAAVAAEGALGSLGCATLSGSEVEDQIDGFRKRTGGKYPIHINFFVHQRPTNDPQASSKARELVAPFYARFGIDEVPQPTEPFFPFDDERLAAVLKARPEIVSFHFGLPSEEVLQTLRSAGIKIMSAATTVKEAKLLEQAGVDAVIAQSYEAGGHRGTFAGDFSTGLIGAMALIPQIADAIKIPVIAAGGIMDVRGIKAAFALGASGVQMGTAFLRTPEANVTPPHRRALAECTEDDTRLTRAFSGGSARSLRNRFLDELAPHDKDLPCFPFMNPLSKPLRMASLNADTPDCLPLWSGQAAPLAREIAAGQVVRDLIRSFEAVAA